MGYTVYILHSSSRDKYYIGQSNNLERRMDEHNSGLSSSTKSVRPWELIYSKSFSTRSEAMNLERKLKSMKSKNYIKKYISNG